MKQLKTLDDLADAIQEIIDNGPDPSRVNKTLDEIRRGKLYDFQVMQLQKALDSWGYNVPKEIRMFLASDYRDICEEARRERYITRKEQRIAREKKQADKSIEIAKQLVPGMVVKMRGTRDHGIREVVSVEHGSVIAFQLDTNGRFTGQTTTHMDTKIVRIIANSREEYVQKRQEPGFFTKNVLK